MKSTDQGRRGAALIIVLAMLLLVAVAAIGFFARTVRLRQSSANDRASDAARVLSDTAVNLVQAQIDHAAIMGNGTAWTSQPGLVRLFDSGGNLRTLYRLYSAQALTASAPAELAADLPPADWASNPALWVDLNAPEAGVSGNNTLRFPILDPRDPANPSATNPIEGFALTSPPGATATQPAPMPVRWLYVLQDGQIVPPTAGGQPGVVTIAGASSANPVVGRIAFWTDDETCRLNINTAGGDANPPGSEGIFWDTPRFDAPDERLFGLRQPATREFPRYPGHPATTTLSKVFPDLTSQELLALTPRYRFGGSEDGTVIATGPVAPKTTRLYNSVGELLFAVDESGNRSTGPLSEQEIESARFFLTAHSRAPETTLFGTPRVSVWPVHDDSAKRTATDKLLAFAASVNNRAYHFTRSDPNSPTADIALTRNANLLDYLDALTSRPIPGFGGAFDAKYPQDRRDLLVKIFDYIRCTNLSDPNLPSADRYAPLGVVAPARRATWGAQGLGRFPVISEISIWFVALGRGATTTPAAPAIPVHAQQVGTKASSGNATFWASALEPAADRVAVQAYVVISQFDPAQGWTGITIGGPNFRVTGLENLSLQVGGTTYPLNMPALSVMRQKLQPNAGNLPGGRRWGGVRNFRDLLAWADAGRSLPLGPNTVGTANRYPLYSDILSIPATGPMRLVSSGPVTVEVFSGNATNTDPANLVSTYSFDFGSLSATDMPVPTVAQNKTNSFGLPTSVSTAAKSAALDRAYLGLTGSTADKSEVVQPGDVLWSLVPTGAGLSGDYRLLASASPPAAAFQPHSAVAAGVNRAFTSPWWNSYLGGATPGGNLVATAPYFLSGNITDEGNNGTAIPAIPSGLNGVTAANNGSTPGDWDNAFSVVPDGPYINKADEGSRPTGTTNPYFDAAFWNQTETGATFFSPNRMIPSAAMLGSLPVGTVSGLPWLTPLFRPAPSDHPGAQSPPDHLLLDLFWMPVAEPYAISEPFSTSGKVNMNYRIFPFTYIERSTALGSVLDSERVAAVATTSADRYKRLDSGLGSDARLPLNLSNTDGTLRQFEEKFASGGVFRSPTEICDIFLVPVGQSWASDAAARAAWYGGDFALVGDNTRERPYANLLGRLTTRSNTYTVHFIAQALRIPANQPQNTWDESRFSPLSHYRGHTTIERYIDPADPALPDYPSTLSAIASTPLDPLSKWRVLSHQRFAP